MTQGLPVFATNRPERGETVAAAVNRMLSITREHLKEPPEVSIASAYINAGGFSLLAGELELAAPVRLLLGAEPDPATDQSIGARAGEGDPERVGRALASHGSWLLAQRNLLGFTRESGAEAQRLLAWLRSLGPDGAPRVEVRRYGRGFLHGKCYLVGSPLLSATVAGSSNFTRAGLSLNAELNLGDHGAPGHVALVREWFDELWDGAEPFDLAGVYAALWDPHAPWTVFLRMLHELYGGEAGDEERPRTELHLTGFQLDGVARMQRLLDAHGGVLVSDEVGLGKTYLAGEVIARASGIDRQKVLIVCPAALKSGMWLPFLDQYDFSRRVEVLSYDELRLRSDPADPGSAAFLRWLDDFALVVVDEAHNLRNPGAQRSVAVNALVGGSRPKRVVLLTATPVNNSLMDLHTLIGYFVRNDAAFAGIGIPSIRGYIKHAQALDPDSLSPEHLFDLMDQVAVRRTRRFVQRHYPHDTIRLPDGRTAAISFPTPRPQRIDYTVDAAGEALLRAVVYALDLPDDTPLVSRYRDRQADPGRLMLARYTPSAYLLDEDLEAHQVANAGLLRSALLKRLESSPAALRRTLRTLTAAHERFLAALDGGYVMTSAALDEWSGSEDEDLDTWVADLDAGLADKVGDAADYHRHELRDDVEADLVLLQQLAALADAAIAGGDPKAGTLIEELRGIAAAARRPDRAGLPASDRRKVLVFSTFADTILDLHRRVEAAVAAAGPDDPLSDYAGRIPAPVRGQKTGVDQQHRAGVLARFAPATAGPLAADGTPVEPDDYDLLFTTDVLSEGVNLQQCGRIINYDLPWNPMRLVQRHGRIDRIGSRHAAVVLGCFFPSAHLDELLGLEETLQRKLAYADAAIGVGDVLPGAAGRFEVNLRDTREQIQGLLEERATLFEDGGTPSAALSGEEYRKRLAAALDNPYTRKAVTGLPWMAGSGFRNPAAARSGYVFCMRMGGDPDPDAAPRRKPWFRFVPVDPATWRPLPAPPPMTGSSWTAAAGDQDGPGAPAGHIVEDDTLISLMTADPGDDSTPRDLPDHVYDAAFDAWAIARDHALADWTELTDPNKFKPELPKAMREAAMLVYTAGGLALSTQDQRELLSRLNTSPPPRVVADIRRAVRDDTLTDTEKITELRRIADDAGLAPAPAPDTLPPITADDIHLIAWMAVQGRDAAE